MGAPFTKLDFGDALNTTFRTISGNIVSLAVISFACMLPVLVLTAGMALAVTPDSVAAMEGDSGLAAGVLGMGFFLTLLTLLFQFIATGAIVHIAVEAVAGNKIGPAEAFATALRRLGGIIGTAIVTGLVIGIGFLACIIPGIILYTMLFVAIPVTVAERVGPFKAFNRSSELTSGARWPIFALVVVIGVINVAMEKGAGLFAEVPGSAGPDGATAALVIGAFLGWITGSIGAILSGVASGVVYTKLRGIREGVDATELASIFR